MPVKQVFRVGSAVLLQDKVVILISYEVEKFKFVTSVLYSVLLFEEQPPRFIVFFPVSSADLHLKACVGTGRAGPLENQSWVFGDRFTVERGHWGRICTE